MSGQDQRDGNIISGGGVTAGIDFALTLAAELASADVARSIQLSLEYAPSPPFDAGTPETASPEILERVTADRAAAMSARHLDVRRAADRLKQ